MPLPDLDTIKQYLRISFAEDDALLGLLRESAIAAVGDYIGRVLMPEDEPAAIAQAVLFLTAHFYEHRATGDDWPPVARRLLDPHRAILFAP